MNLATPSMCRGPRVSNCLITIATALALSIGSVRPALAQIDSDPSNDTVGSADALPLAVGSAISNLASFDDDQGDIDFFNVALPSNQVFLGFTAPMDNLPVDMGYPDTLSSVMFGGTPLTFS